MTRQNDDFDFQSAHKAPTYQVSHLSNLLRVLSKQRIVNTEFFGSFSCSCKRISFSDGSQLVVVNF